MIRIIDSFKKISSAYVNGKFNMDHWKEYINSIYQDCADIFTDEIQKDEKENLYSFHDDCLPIINEVIKQDDLLLQAHESFLEVVDEIDPLIISTFGKPLELDIVFYLGLCNGAGWVTKINHIRVVLLGVEKIIELKWYSPKMMKSLIYHELGHVYQDTYGVLEKTFDFEADQFIWQLFCEGFAMLFEQLLVGDINFFHQFNQDQLIWLNNNIKSIITDFNSDLLSISNQTQRWFGDWVEYQTMGDVGYFLGARFVQFIYEKYAIDEIINLDFSTIKDLFYLFNSRYL